MTIAASIEAFIREAAERALTETPEERAERAARQERLFRRYGADDFGSIRNSLTDAPEDDRDGSPP